MRMYVHHDYIILRAHLEEKPLELINRLSEIMEENFPLTFDSERSNMTDLNNQRIVMGWAFKNKESVIEAADVMLDYFEQERRSDVFVRFCLPDCGPELWPGEWLINKSES